MISVQGVSMRFGTKVLFEDVTTTFSKGRRYGLTGPNGSGKSTFMKLLTGEALPQKGTVVRPDKLGVLRQDQFAFDEIRVVDTVIMGNQRLWQALQAREVLYAKPTLTDADGMRLGELEGIVGEEDGYSAESDAAILLQGLDIDALAARKEDGRAPGRTEGPRASGAGAVRTSGSAAARRADEPSGPGFHPLAARVPHPLRRHAHRHLARSSFPQRDLHARRRHRLPDDHHVHGRLRRHGAREDADSIAHREGLRAARQEDRAAERLHRALLGRHAVEPGPVTAQGSGAARNDGARAVQHPAPVHQVLDGAAVGQDRPRVQGRVKSVRHSTRSSRISAPS